MNSRLSSPTADTHSLWFTPRPERAGPQAQTTHVNKAAARQLGAGTGIKTPPRGMKNKAHLGNPAVLPGRGVEVNLSFPTFSFPFSH